MLAAELWPTPASLWRACFRLPVLCVENYLILCLPKTMIYSHYWFKMLYRLIFNPSIPGFSLSKAISWYCLQIMQSRMTSVRESSWGWQIIAVRTEEWLPWTFKKPQDVTEQNLTGCYSWSLCSWTKLISLGCVFLLLSNARDATSLSSKVFVMCGHLMKLKAWHRIGNYTF